jgi:hypothetical protein
MFGTVDEPGLIPKCLHRIFLNVGQNIDDKVLYKPVGLENLIPIIDSDLNMEIAARNYIFKDEKVITSSKQNIEQNCILLASNSFTKYSRATKLFRRSFR